MPISFVGLSFIPMTTLKSMNYLRLIRPQHWIKNFFVLIPLFFGGELFDVIPILTLKTYQINFDKPASFVPT